MLDIISNERWFCLLSSQSFEIFESRLITRVPSILVQTRNTPGYHESNIAEDTVSSVAGNGGLRNHEDETVLAIEALVDLEHAANKLRLTIL